MDAQKRKRHYFQNNVNDHKKRKQFTLAAGMTGFLCTCNFREKDCIRDAYKLLNEFTEENNEVDKHEETGAKPEEDDDVSQTESGHEEDISTALDKEINELKADFKKPVVARKFQVMDTGVKNVMFIRSSLPNPSELVTKIITELDETKKQRTRFLLRLIPIEASCKAYMNDIKIEANKLFEKYFSQEPKTFCIVFNRHSNNNIQRQEIIRDLAEIVAEKNAGHKVDLKNPQIAVVVEVLRGICLFSIAPDYFKFKKYNLFEICNVEEKKDDGQLTGSIEPKELESSDPRESNVPSAEKL